MIPVKAIEFDGDWFVIPSMLRVDFEKMTDKFLSEDYHNKYADMEKFEKIFGKYRTGGDLNNVQLYVKKITV